ncbi:TraR/DksA family transcriptional regulator [Kineococcus sp. SYSU DK001]|uniref:TraR/DksA family transcriptional regulator n=1 Tax=Kineococcus sp. SYSU DK001 TaxID=3383122 RepID=UPI003D7D7901
MNTRAPAPTVAHGLPGPAAPIDPERLEALRRALEEDLRVRRALLRSFTAEDLQRADTDPTTAAELAAARRTTAEADEALARVRAGTYGRCVHCAGTIPVERLELRPHAAACVPCARRLGPAPV